MSKRYPLVAMWGAALSRISDEMSGAAILLFAYSTSDDVGRAAFVFGSLTAAAAVGGPLLGVWLDRARSGARLALALAAYSAGLAGCAVALHAHLTTVAICVALAAGLAGPAVAGGWSAALVSSEPAVARRLSLIDACSYSTASLIGPALAGGAYAVLGPTVPLWLTLVLLLAGALAATRIVVAAPSIDQHPARALLAGTSVIRRDRQLRTVTVSSCVAFVGFGAFTVAIPLIGATRFGNAGYGFVLLAVMACTALAANLVVDRLGAIRRPLRTFTAATALTGCGIGLLILPGWPGALLGAAIAGVGDGPQLATLIQLRHQRSPSALRTQVFTSGASFKIGAAGVGAYAAGLLSSDDVTPLIASAALAYLLAAAMSVRHSDTGGLRRSCR